MAEPSGQRRDTPSNLPDLRGLQAIAARVYLISDVRLYRDGLVASLSHQSRIDVVGAGASSDFLGQIAALQPEVLLLDLGACDSLSIPRRAQQILPALHVIAFAVAEMEENVLACAEAGLSGYVAKDGSVEDLVEAIIHALRGELVCSPRIAGLLFTRMSTLARGASPACAGAALTSREREIAVMLAGNLSLANKEIARRLRLSPATVKNHVHNILQKLNIDRRGDLRRFHRLEFQGTPTLPSERGASVALPRLPGSPTAYVATGIGRV
jgi:two-component system nitrate/nitrite response regulator NarL